MARPQCGRSDLASQLCGPRSKDRARNIANLISCNISVAPDWLPAAQICPQKQSSAQTPRTMCGHAVGHTRICQMFVFAHQRGGRDFSNHISAVQPPIGCPKKRQVESALKGGAQALGLAKSPWAIWPLSWPWAAQRLHVTHCGMTSFWMVWCLRLKAPL